MKQTLEKLSQIQAPVCVTIVLNTHKTHPENQKDGIHLKNMITQATERLQNEFGVDYARRYTEKLLKLGAEIDHNYNELGLMLFVNDDIAEYLRLPIKVNDRVIIDKTFATRPIVRSLKQDTDYYVLVLNKQNARLIEASMDTVVDEIRSEGFPFKGKGSLTTDKHETGNITQEFFNSVDKAINVIRKAKPLPIVIYAEENNYHQYLKEADFPKTILGHVTLQNFDESPTSILRTIWPLMAELTIAKNRARISELEQAVGVGKYLVDINEIWKAIREGRGDTLFLEEGYIQSVREEADGTLTPIEYSKISSKNDIDDILDEMIEQTLKFGGDVVFLEKDSMKDFNKLALVTRY
ncbi:MAG: hypothetical protein J5I52_04815 [Saprospiraceae bacterium]|nr:MAG: hypothetical protein UZ09_BCD002000623 [Bacteroidetes bacterium OLB9]MCO6463453.1 hypothetical protein [Saprospiraceae bacterium]MCZ2338806.1 hypothetical protein [Chitinophagales bacterium]